MLIPVYKDNARHFRSRDSSCDDRNEIIVKIHNTYKSLKTRYNGLHNVIMLYINKALLDLSCIARKTAKMSERLRSRFTSDAHVCNRMKGITEEFYDADISVLRKLQRAEFSKNLAYKTGWDKATKVFATNRNLPFNSCTAITVIRMNIILLWYVTSWNFQPFIKISTRKLEI